jgi:hypothetical protein
MEEITMKKSLLGLIAVLASMAAIPANAAIVISEVAPWSSGNSPVGADWFELTNTGASSVNITGWQMDDDSKSFNSAVLLNGINAIASGQSVIFVEGDTATTTNFIDNWFAGNAPANFLIGYYSGSKVGLSSSGDEVNIFDTNGSLQASVSFGASTNGYTFDNGMGLTGNISNLSVAGTNGAFSVTNSSITEIGSPGTIAAAVPEPETYAFFLAGLGLIGFSSRKHNI